MCATAGTGHLLPYWSGDKHGTPDIFARSPVSTVSIRVSTGSLTDQLCSPSHFLPFLHFKDKFSTHGLKKAPGQSCFLLLSNSLPEIKSPFEARRMTSPAPLRFLQRTCFPTPVSPPQAFLTLSVPEALQGGEEGSAGEIKVASKFLLFPEP